MEGEQSSIIFEGERSFNPPSTPSRLNFTSFIHHHLSTTTSALALSTQSSNLDSAASLSPPLRDVGSIHIASVPSQARMLSQPPLPFPKGCGRHSLARRRIRGGRKTRGTHEVGCPNGELRNMSHDICRGSFSRSPLPNPSLTPLVLPPGPNEIPKQQQ